MLGNSYTFCNNMPDMLAEILDCEVVAHTRSGARLAEQLNPNTKMGAETQRALKEEKWDYVVLQEMSNGPITAKKSFLKSVSELCNQIRQNGAVPVLYATWAYKRGGKQMETMDCDYEQMYRMIYDAYHEAAKENHALIADVGKRFYELSETTDLYIHDGSHPTKHGSIIIAETIAKTIRKYIETEKL